jgi:hypothetical protein
MLQRRGGGRAGLTRSRTEFVGRCRIRPRWFRLKPSGVTLSARVGFICNLRPRSGNAAEARDLDSLLTPPDRRLEMKSNPFHAEPFDDFALAADSAESFAETFADDWTRDDLDDAADLEPVRSTWSARYDPSE